MLTALKLQVFYRENPYLTDLDKHDSLLEKCIGTYPYLDSDEEEIERKELKKEVTIMNRIKLKQQIYEANEETNQRINALLKNFTVPKEKVVETAILTEAEADKAEAKAATENSTDENKEGSS